MLKGLGFQPQLLVQMLEAQFGRAAALPAHEGRDQTASLQQLVAAGEQLHPVYQ